MKRLAAFFFIFVTNAVLAAPAGMTAAGAVRVLTRDTSAMGGPALRHGASYEAAAGTPVSVTQIPFADLYERVMLGFVTGGLPYDVLLIPSAWLPDFAPFLSTVPPGLVEAPAFADVLPIYRDALMRWDDQWKALTIDGELHLGTYRRDLFEDPAAQAAFRAGYGRPLEPPRTWREYRDIAAFFSGSTTPDGPPL